MKKRREANPFLSGYSQASGLAGGLASAAGAAGTGARLLGAVGAPTRAILGAGRAAGGLGRTLFGAGRTGRFVGAGLQAATEGALYGLGQEASRASLGGEEITAEKLLAAGGHGALWGAGTAGALGVAAPLLRRGGRAALGMAQRSGGLDDLARAQTRKAIGVKARDVRNLGDDSLNMMSDDLLGYELRSGPNAGKKIIRPGRDVKGLADDIATAKNEVGEHLALLKNQVDEITIANPAKMPSLQTYLSRVDEQVLNPLRGSTTGSGRKMVRAVEKELAPVREAAERGEVWTFKKLEGHRNELFKAVENKRRNGKMSGVPIKDAERTLDKYLGEIAEDALASSTGGAKQYREAKRMMYSLIKAGEMAEAELGRSAGRSSMSLIEKGAAVAGAMGTIATGNVGALVGGAATGAANRALSRYGNSTLASMAKSIQKMNLKLDTGVKAAVAGSSTASASTAGRGMVGAEIGDLVKTTQDRIAEVKRLASNPALAMARTDKATSGLNDREKLKAAAVARQVTAVQFLASKTPRQFTRAGNSLTPHLADPKLSAAEARKFHRYFRGVDDPMAVVDDLANGKVDREGIEAIKVVYPKIFQEMRARVMDATMRRSEPLPYSRRIMLGTVFDFPADRSLDPAYLQRTQALHAEKEQAPPPKQSPPPSNSRGGEKLLTPTQKLEV